MKAHAASSNMQRRDSYLDRGKTSLPMVRAAGKPTPRASSPTMRGGAAIRTSPARRSIVVPPMPPPPVVPRLIDQCLPLQLCTPKPSVSRDAPDSGTDRKLIPNEKTSSPTARLIKRANGCLAHLLELPSEVPYAVEVHKGVPHGKVHVIPCLTPAAAWKIRQDADATAKRLGGWAPRAVGCCTNDVLVSQLSASSQQLVYDAFRRIIMPYATSVFPNAKLSVDALPRSVECFFVIKYIADKPRKEFGEHTDHTKLTVNICLTEPGTDHTSGGLFLPVPKGGALDGNSATHVGKEDATKGSSSPGGSVASAVMSALGTARRAAAGAVGGVTTTSSSLKPSSGGLVLRPRAGTAILHHGDIRHAGDKIESGERMQLVAFFYGSERRGNALPLANVSRDQDALSAAQIIRESWPANAKRDPDGKPTSDTNARKSPHRVPSRVPSALSAHVKGLQEAVPLNAVRNLTLTDVAALAKP